MDSLSSGEFVRFGAGSWRVEITSCIAWHSSGLRNRMWVVPSRENYDVWGTGGFDLGRGWTGTK